MPDILLRTSERAAFKRCQQRWYWGFREGLKPNGTEKQPLWFGTGFHLAFAEWYIPGQERGRDPRETWAEYVGESRQTVRLYNDDDDAEFESALDLGNAMLTHYLNDYGDDPDWKMIAPEQTFRIYIEDPEAKGEVLLVYVGTFDGIYQNVKTGKYWLLEHKTASQIATKHLPLDDQAGSYILVANDVLKELGIDAQITGIMYNFLAKRKPTEKPRDSMGRYLNKDGSVSKVQPSPTLLREPVNRTRREKNKMLERIQNEGIQMEVFRTGELEPTKNPTKDCSWDCDFFELCQVDETGGDVEEFKRAVFRVEDPYMDHRLGAKNTKESLALTRELKMRS